MNLDYIKEQNTDEVPMERPLEQPNMVMPETLPLAPESAIPASPDIYAESDALKSSAYASQQKTLMDAAISGQKLAAQEAGYYDQMAKQQEKTLVDAQEKEQIRQKAIDDHMSQINSAQKDYSDEKIDSNRVWNNKTTGQKIMAGLSVFLLGAGGAQDPLKYINQEIDRDIDEQKAEIAKKKDVLGQKTNLLSDMRAKFSDERSAENTARIIGITTIQSKINSLAPKLQSEEQKLKLGTLYNKLDEQKAQLAQDSAKRINLNQAKNILQGDMGQSVLMKAVRLLPEKDQAGYIERHVKGPGFEGFTRNAQTAKELTEDIANNQSTLQNIDALIKMGGRQFPGQEGRAKADSISKLLVGNLNKVITGGGPMTEQERKLVEEVAANPTNIFQINAIPRLEALKGIVERSLKNKAKANGLKVAAEPTFKEMK